MEHVTVYNYLQVWSKEGFTKKVWHLQMDLSIAKIWKKYWFFLNEKLYLHFIWIPVTMQNKSFVFL